MWDDPWIRIRLSVVRQLLRGSPQHERRRYSETVTRWPSVSEGQKTDIVVAASCIYPPWEIREADSRHSAPKLGTSKRPWEA